MSKDVEYISNVTIAFYARGAASDANSNTTLNLWFDQNYPHYVAATEWGARTERQNDGRIIVQYEHVEWREGKPHVQDVIEALRNFDDTFDGFAPDAAFAWEMVRLGQDDTDIEIDQGEYSDQILYVRRTIEEAA
jgi:hypothetical protein